MMKKIRTLEQIIADLPAERRSQVLASAQKLIHDREAEGMVSLRKAMTGVDNTVFLTTKGYYPAPSGEEYCARLEVAVNPPHTLDAANAEVTSMAILTGTFRFPHEKLPMNVWKQTERFIERNRDALFHYWNCEIDTAELIKRLTALPE
jgi:hypothetical protein